MDELAGVGIAFLKFTNIKKLSKSSNIEEMINTEFINIFFRFNKSENLFIVFT